MNNKLTDTTLKQAQEAALVASDKHGLPQTVYKDKESCGWWHTNPLAGRLHQAAVAVTMLPRNYFA